MNGMKEWLTANEAAFVVGRHLSQIYRWIDAGRLKPIVDPQGRNLINSKELMRVEATVKRGRPAGTASRNGDN